MEPRAAELNRYAQDVAGLTVASLVANWPVRGAGWELVEADVDAIDRILADCLLVAGDDAAALSALADGVDVPLVLAIRPDAALLPELADMARGYVFAADDADVMGAVFAGAVARPGQVRDIAGSANTINALSVEAQRIAEALARLAQSNAGEPGEQPVTAALVRRLVRLRRERDRFFPAEIFADPAWDMLLDLAAARLDGQQVPVSSLCIAASVPTTTALRWIRSLTEAGVFERRTDPFDARRAYISMSPAATEGIMAWLKLFASAFSLR